MKEEIAELVIEITGQVVREQGIEHGPVLTVETPLFGEGGVLDSMALVSLVLAVEEAMEDRYGAGVALADERALSRRNSPFRTIGSLADYAAEALGGKVD